MDDQAEKRTVSEEMDALKKLMGELPPAADDDQAKVLSALDELMASLDRLSTTVDEMTTDNDNEC